MRLPTAPDHWPRCGPILTALALSFVFYSVIPTFRWIPYCGDEPVEGNYRDIYIDLFVDWLDSTEVYYWRFGDVVLIRELGWGDGADMNIGDVILNGKEKLAAYVGEDIVVDGVLHPAPPEVARLMRELEPLLGPDPRIRPDGQVAMGYDQRITWNCDLFRAAILEPSR